jgi:archaeal flagellar protein FlaJ
MRINKSQKFGIIFFIAVSLIAFFLFFKEQRDVFYFILCLGLIIGSLPFMMIWVMKNNKEEENNQMFLEFSRDLVESVRSGTPISKGIVNLKNKDYGSLSPNIKKLANQITLGVTVRKSFEVFSRDLNNNIINRAVMLISESEKAGGNIEDILESVSKSVSEIEKLKKERKAAIYNLVIEGYVIFFVFIAIMLIMEFSIMPLVEDIDTMDFSFHQSPTANKPNEMNLGAILMLVLIFQGFFTGLIVGKLSEGNIKSGIKHSFIMVASALVIYLGAKIFLG